jgi:hypothetical protein
MWLPSDTAWVSEWQRYQATLCKKCRTTERDWWDEHGLPLKEPKYEFDTRRCPGCQAHTLGWGTVVKRIGDDEVQLAGLEGVFVPYGTKAARQAADDADWGDD